MFKVLFLIVFNLQAFTADIFKNNSCITPYKEEGICVKPSTCPAILSAFDTMPGQAFQIWKDSHCGCDGGKVCCGSLISNTYPQIFTCDSTTKENVSFALVSDAAVCGMDKFSTNRILGGTIVNFGEFPWLVAIESNSKIRNDSADIRCGGTIVTKRYILTAAHCIAHHEFVATRVWLGVTNIGPEGNCLNITGKPYCIDSVQKIIIEEVYPHPTYNSINSTNDIGLVLLEGSVEYSDHVRPICLPPSDSATSKAGTVMTVAGWGATDQRGTRSNIKLKLDLPLENNEVCNTFLKGQFREITAKQLCVGGEYLRGTCQGDSGGPLMKDFINANGDVKWYQEGIISYGSGCGRNGRPTVHTKVSSYVRWISHTIDRQYDLVVVNVTALDDACTTPNWRAGTCVPLSTCEEVFKKVATKNKDGYSYARESRCGYENETLVCCEHPGSVIQPNFNSTALPNKTTCGVVKDEARIVGGTLADLGQFPWMAAVEFISKLHNNNGGIRCGGSVINSRYVLTVAHCILDVEYNPTTVWLGDLRISTDPDCKPLFANFECAEPVQKIPIKKAIPHVYFDSIKKQDNIGLILLENEIKFSDYVAPICLQTENLPLLQPGTRMTVIGWGVTEEGKGTPSDILRKVELPLRSNEVCNEFLAKRNIKINTQQLCVGGEKDKSGCQGDSGGPLIRIYEDKVHGTMQWYQEGLTSFGVGCGYEGRPAIYTKVASYTNWIISIISED